MLSYKLCIIKIIDPHSLFNIMKSLCGNLSCSLATLTKYFVHIRNVFLVFVTSLSDWL